MRGARSKLDAVSCGRIAEKLVPSSDRLRRIVVAIALVAVVAASLSAAGTAAASENGAVYVNDDGYVEFVDDDQDGKQTKNATEQQADVVGTAIDLNGDGNVEAPVVDGETLRLVRPDGTNETLVADGVAAVAIAVDDVDGDETSDVLYVNESDGNSVWRVSGDGETRKPRADVEATAVAGYGDFDGDGADETVFVGASQRLKYVGDNGSVESTGYGDVAGVGPLANYDGESGTRVAVVDGSNNEIKLIDADGNEKDIGGNAAATPIGKTNLYGDEASEVVYVNEDDDQLEVVGVNDSPRPVTSGDSPFEVDDAGAAGGQGIDLTPPPVTVGAPENRTYIKYAEKVPLNVSAEEEDTVWNYSIDSINDGEKVPFEPNTYLDEEEDLDPGKQYNLTVYAEDSNGNVRTIERTFGVGESGSTVVYVDDESGKLSYIPPNPDQKRVVETSVSRDEDGGFIAAGPAIHYDADGQLDIPYVREGAGNDDESPLKLYHVADGTTTTIEKNAMDIGGDGGKIATADFDDDGRFDIVYRGEDKNLKRVDGNDGPDQFVDEDTDPQAIIGSADVVEGDDEARGREIVWVDASSEVKAVSQYSREVYSDEELSFNESLGSNDNVGAGEPLPIVRGGPKYFPIVDGSANPGVLNARDGSYQQLANDDDVNAKKAPVGLADINDDAWKELLFIDDNGEVKYAKANPGRADNEIRELGVDDGELVTDGTGEAIEPDASVGVVATHFAQRVNDYYEYPGDDTAPSVEILEPADTEYEDEVPIDVRTDEPIDKWYYSVDGNETQFDGPQQLLTDLSRGSNTITVRVVDFEGKEDTASETFQVTRADPPDESEAAPQTTPQTATAATATPAPTATPTPTPATAPAATPTPTTTSNTTSTPTATSTAESTSNTATTGAEQAGSLNWVFPLLVLVVIAIAVFAVRQRDREE